MTGNGQLTRGAFIINDIHTFNSPLNIWISGWEFELTDLNSDTTMTADQKGRDLIFFSFLLPKGSFAPRIIFLEKNRNIWLICGTEN